MIDQNRDGFIDKEDLHDMLASMGTNMSVQESLTLRYLRFACAIAMGKCTGVV